jgi:hypothetical protein
MSFSTVEVVVPDVNKHFKSGNVDYSTPSGKKANVELMRRIIANYGPAIQRWCEPLGLPFGVIVGFIATESAGVMAKPNAFDATGLMQVTSITVYETIVGWRKEVKIPMPASILAEIRSKLPMLLESKPPAYSAAKSKISSVISTDASFNILAGCINLRWLCERFSNNGDALFNRVMVAYNAGAFTSSQMVPGTKTQANKTRVDTTSLVNNSAVPMESRSYLVKMLGKDGFLDLYFKQNLVK